MPPPRVLQSMYLACLAVSLSHGLCLAQDTAAVRRPDSTVAALPDSASVARPGPLRARAASLGRRSLATARRGERVVFGADSAVEVWAQHDDPASRVIRRVSPVAFWVPIAAAVTTPIVWADEAQDGHDLNAEYARSATAGLALAVLASRTAKYFVHRARPCTGEPPGDVIIGALPDSLPGCPRRSGVAGYTSFFSEHTVALFAIASATTFQAQRQNAPNAATVAAVAFTGASVFSLGRIYQNHHWLSDVVIAAAVGTASGWVGAQLGPRSAR